MKTLYWGMMLAATAGAAVRYVPAKKLFILDSERTTYALGVNERGELQTVYWGGRVPDTDLPAARATASYAFESRESLTPEEYPGWGGMRFSEPALKAAFDDGVRDVVLLYDGHDIEGEGLEIRLKDIKSNLIVHLDYQVYPRHDIVRRAARIENKTGKPLLLESAQSAAWNLPSGEDYRLTYLAGRWAGETQIQRIPLRQGKQLLESRRGNTSHQMNPFFAIDWRGEATEESGRVWFGQLGWSGNWKIAVEQTPNQQLRVTGGFHDFDFGYRLRNNESLETPPFYAGYTDAGFGEMSRKLHRFQLDEILPRASAGRPRPVLYNSWEATEFHVDEAGQKKLADKAAKLGVELFVMDDGWFGARDHDKAGLGDWTVNPKKFPNGLKPLIEHVNKLGMKFGLWVEPEMVNPDSELFRAHPDWAIQMPGRPLTEGRNQLILNMARAEVREHIYNVLDKLLKENPGIEFLKWDMNRHVSEPGWTGAPPEDQKKLWVEYPRAVYNVIDRLRARHPKVEIESCSGGGGRVDLGILRRVEQVWTSDNTEAFDRLRIQDGFSLAYTPKVMMDWVTDVPNMNGRSTPLQFRFFVAEQGSLGIGGDLNKWSEADMKLAAGFIWGYKATRRTIQEGRLYRLYPGTENFIAREYVSDDGRQVVLFVYQHAQQFRKEAPTVYLRGLDPNAMYKINISEVKLIGGNPGRASGAWLMNRGLHFRMTGDYDSTAVVLDRE